MKSPRTAPLLRRRRAVALLAAALVAALVATGCGPLEAQPIVAVTPLSPGGPARPAEAETPSVAVTPEAIGSSPSAAPRPTPLSLQMPAGEAAALLAAQDAAWQPTPRARIVFDTSPVPLAFDEFYDGYNVRTGLILSDKLVSLDGQQVVMQGYMAPPLKPELDFFVLTRQRLAVCPFCSTAADWPDDIVVVYLMDGTMRTTENPLRLQGRLEVGPLVDPETGMVSIVRIYADEVEQLSTLGIAP